MELKKLEKLGLNSSEAKIYVALLDLGGAQAGKISKRTKINRTTTYDAIKRLIEKGLVTYINKTNIKIFKPVNPNKLLDKLKEKEKIIKEILPNLNALFNQNKDEEETIIFKGRIGIRTILKDILNYKKYVAFGSSGNFLEIMKHDFEIFQKEKERKKIQARIILTEKDKNTKQVNNAYSKFKFMKDKFSSTTTTFVYGDKTAIIIWSKIPTATLIKSKDIAKSNQSHFEAIWD